jgi:hypothetical protein
LSSARKSKKPRDERKILQIEIDGEYLPSHACSGHPHTQEVEERIWRHSFWTGFDSMFQVERPPDHFSGRRQNE